MENNFWKPGTKIRRISEGWNHEVQVGKIYTVVECFSRGPSRQPGVKIEEYDISLDMQYFEPICLDILKEIGD